MNVENSANIYLRIIINIALCQFRRKISRYNVYNCQSIAFIFIK